MNYSQAKAADLRHSNLNDVLLAAESLAGSLLHDNAGRIDAEGFWPAEGMRALQKSGLGGLVVPGKFGGLGHGAFALAKVCELLGSECAATAICFGMHCVGSSVISAQATDYQGETYLREIAAGRHLTTLALSERGTGSHFYYPQTRLIREAGDRLKISGEKQFVTNGGYADSYVASAMHGDSDDTRFSCVIVDADTQNLTWGEAWSGFGMRGNQSRAVKFDGLSIPSENLLGAEGDQIWYVFNVVAPFFLMAMSGTYLGVAGAALDIARQHLKQRSFQHDGRHLADATVVQHRIGTLWGKLEATRRLVYSAGTRFDAGDEDAVVAVMLSKAEVAETATDIVGECMSLMGGMAYRDGARIQRLLRDVRAAHVMAPTTDLLRTWAGRMLLDQPILGE